MLPDIFSIAGMLYLFRTQIALGSFVNTGCATVSLLTTVQMTDLFVVQL